MLANLGFGRHLGRNSLCPLYKRYLGIDEHEQEQDEEKELLVGIGRWFDPSNIKLSRWQTRGGSVNKREASV